MKRPRLSLLSATALSVAIAGVFLALAPAALGGKVTFVTVTGSSMEPGLHGGDLVLARERDSYVTGDVVVYRHPDLGLVIHRVIGRDGAAYVLQGDNNAFIDGEQPLARDIAGAEWITIPAAGDWLTHLRHPAALGALIFAAAMGAFWGDSPARKRKRHWARRPAIPVDTGVPS